MGAALQGDGMSAENGLVAAAVEERHQALITALCDACVDSGLPVHDCVGIMVGLVVSGVRKLYPELPAEERLKAAFLWAAESDFLQEQTGIVQ